MAAPRTTATTAAEGRLVVDAVDKIFLLEPNKHPLVSLLTNVGRVWDGKAWTGASLRKAPCYNPAFDWFEGFYGGRYAKVSGIYGGAGGVTITVSGAGTASGRIFTMGDIIRNARTGENMLVEASASDTTITIAASGRSFGATAATAGADGDGLYIVGNVNEENATARNVNTTRSVKETNYTQIFRTSISVSNTDKASKLYGGPDLPHLRAKLGTQHALDVERAFWFSEKNSTTGTNGHPLRSTGGVNEFIESNNAYVQNQGGVLTAPDFNTFLREGFTYGSDTKLLFAGGVVLQAINEFARGQLQTKPKETTYGVKISEYVTAFGVINIVHHPLFVEDYAGSAFLIDMDCLRYRYMDGRDTKLSVGIQAPGTDGQVDEYLTECGLERIQAAKCALIKGVTA